MIVSQKAALWKWSLLSEGDGEMDAVDSYPNERLTPGSNFFSGADCDRIDGNRHSTSLVFVGAFLALSVSHFSASHHQQIIRPRIDPLENGIVADICDSSTGWPDSTRIGAKVIPHLCLRLNGTAFPGLSTPKVVVLYWGVFKVMDQDEILFILGHELGEVSPCVPG